MSEKQQQADEARIAERLAAPAAYAYDGSAET